MPRVMLVCGSDGQMQMMIQFKSPLNHLRHLILVAVSNGISDSMVI